MGAGTGGGGGQAFCAGQLSVGSSVPHHGWHAAVQSPAHHARRLAGRRAPCLPDYVLGHVMSTLARWYSESWTLEGFRVTWVS